MHQSESPNSHQQLVKTFHPDVSHSFKASWYSASIAAEY